MVMDDPRCSQSSPAGWNGFVASRCAMASKADAFRAPPQVVRALGLIADCLVSLVHALAASGMRSSWAYLTLHAANCQMRSGTLWPLAAA